MKYDYLKLVEVIKNRRNVKGISTRELALKVGVSQSEISKFENGLKANFYLIPFIKLCKELDLDVIDLLEYAGFLDIDNDVLYDVKITNVDENNFYIKARNPKEAMLNVVNFALLNNLIKVNPEIELELELHAVDNEIEEEFEEEIVEDEEIFSCESCEYYCPNCGMCCFEE